MFPHTLPLPLPTAPPPLQPLHPELLLSEARARQVVQQYAVHYVLSGQAARQLGVNPRLLGRLTGNIWVNDSCGERVDVGLAVKNAKQGLCVPGGCGGAGCWVSVGLKRCCRVVGSVSIEMLAYLFLLQPACLMSTAWWQTPCTLCWSMHTCV
jgi:hypothetical protein